MKTATFIKIMYFTLLFFLLNLPLLFYDRVDKSNLFVMLYQLFLLVEVGVLFILVVKYFCTFFCDYIPEQIENYFKNK